MYEDHWGLSETPFSSDLDPRSFFESPMHEEALARLHFLVEQRRRLGLLLGTHGSGKSLLMEVLYQQMRRAGRPVARLRLVGLSAEEFPGLLALELGVEQRSDESLISLWRSISDRVTENRLQQWGTMILLDDVDEAGPELQAVIARLAQLDLSRDAQLTVVMTASPERVTELSPRLMELSELRIDLESWDEEDTADFLTASLRRVGRDEPAFSDAAIARLHQLSGGIPRRVRQLADWALMAGAGQQQQQIDAHTVEAVFEELGVGDLEIAMTEPKAVSTNSAA